MEYACRAGTTTVYSWGNDINSSVPIITGMVVTDRKRFKQTRDVGQYAANPWGFFDMHGNVWEWVYDWKELSLVLRPIPRVRHRARSGLRGWFLALVGTHCVLLSVATTPRNRDQLGFRVAFQAIQPIRRIPNWILFGGAAITRERQASAEPGVEAHDARDGNITDQIVVTGTVDMNSTGTYLLTYTVQDGAGKTTTATRTVTVVGNRTVDLNATVAMDMIWCPPGTFTMGSPTTEAGRRSDRGRA